MQIIISYISKTSAQDYFTVGEKAGLVLGGQLSFSRRCTSVRKNCALSSSICPSPTKWDKRCRNTQLISDNPKDNHLPNVSFTLIGISVAHFSSSSIYCNRLRRSIPSPVNTSIMALRFPKTLPGIFPA